MSAIEAKLLFIEKLAKHHPEHVSHLSLVGHLRDRRRIFESKAGVVAGTWLVIPFHPKFEVVKSKVAEFNMNFGHLLRLYNINQISVSYTARDTSSSVAQMKQVF